MKDFVKMTLAVLCGLFIMGILNIFIFFGMAGAMASFGSSTPVLPKQGVLFMDMSKVHISEQPKEADPMSIIQGNTDKSLGLWDAVNAINQASEDPTVQFIFMKTDGTSVGLAKLEELRTALEVFRTSGKAGVAYVENPTTASYYLASVADKIYVGDYAGGSSMIFGVGTTMFYLKDVLDKLGINVQFIRHGKFKSAGETYIRSTPSEENLRQTKEMIGSMWDNIAEKICKSRGMDRNDLDSVIDNLEINTPADFLKYSLADTLMTKEALKEKLAVLAQADSYSDVKFIPFADYVTVKTAVPSGSSDKIAVIYADGEIIDGYEKEAVAGDRFAGIIAEAKADSSVKAVVFRVSSPGGSVYASDKIKKEIDALRKVKPVVASYGEYAASGGYWISNSCDKIFSDASTITGSIGVFSMVPDLSKTAKDLLGVNVTTVGSSPHSDMFSLTRPLDKQEYDFVQRSVDQIYEEFVNNVANGRDMSPASVDSLAQGRVWTGADALKLGLVDEIGSLYDAVSYAARLAGDPDLASWEISSLPKPLSSIELLLESLAGSSNVLAGTPFEELGKVYNELSVPNAGKVYARMPYVFTID